MNMYNANLSNADLTNATGTPSLYTTATYYLTHCPDGTVAGAGAQLTCQGHPWP